MPKHHSFSHSNGTTFVPFFPTTNEIIAKKIDQRGNYKAPPFISDEIEEILINFRDPEITQKCLRVTFAQVSSL